MTEKTAGYVMLPELTCVRPDRREKTIKKQQSTDLLTAVLLVR